MTFKKGKEPERRHIPIPERCNERTKRIATVSTKRILGMINHEDHEVARAIGKILRQDPNPVTKTATTAIRQMARGGRLVYIGTGTGGRMGLIDSLSIPSNYGVVGLVVAVIANGPEEPTRKYAQPAVDDPDEGVKALKKVKLNEKDMVIGLSISGRTAFTIAAVEYAHSIGCRTACITCDPGSPITKSVEIPIEVDVGPEVITGSTRMKSSTALKQILNMISTAAMVKLRYTSGNRMSHVIPKDRKRQNRAVDVLMSELTCRRERAEELLKKAHNDPRAAIVMTKAQIRYQKAAEALEQNRNSVQQALKWLAKQKR